MDGVATSMRYLETVHLWQAHGYKLNASVGAIMAHKVSGRLCYFHAGANNYRLLVSLVTMEQIEDLESLQGPVDGRSWTDHAASLMPDSAWRVVCITNVEYYVYHNLAAPIQGPTDLSNDDDESDDDDVALPSRDENANPIGQMQGLAEPKRYWGKMFSPDYKNRLCVFKCLAWLDGRWTANGLMSGGLYYFHQLWISREGFQDMEEFPGLTMDEPDSVQTMFSTGFRVYTQDDNEIRYQSARLLRRPLPGMNCVLNVHLEGDQHFRPIEDLRMYARCTAVLSEPPLTGWRCTKRPANGPGRALWVEAMFLRAAGSIGCRRGPGTSILPIHGHLWRGGMPGACLRGHLYKQARAHVCLPGEQCPRTRGPLQLHLRWLFSGGWHDGLPMGHVRCRTLLNVGYMDPYLSQLDDLSFCQGMEMECTWDLEDAETEGDLMLSSSTGAHALTIFKARWALEQWIRCMPVVSFDGGRNDLQLIKPYLAAIYGTYVPPWLRHFQTYEGPELSADADGMSPWDRPGDEITSVLKKGSCFTAIYTHRLAFLDVRNYLPAGGFRCAKYLQTYRGTAYQGGKSFFPYEYVDDLAHLRDPLPGYAAFYSSLCGENTLEEALGWPHGQQNYAELCRLWVRKGMTSLRDLLIHNNNCDVVPFLTAIQKQCDIYKQAELDLLKDGPSLSSIGMRYGMHDAEGLFYTFGLDQADLTELLNTAILGGPSIVFKRHAEVGHTTIREPDYAAEALPCCTLVGFDANSLYPWGMAQDMPIGTCHVRSGLDFTVDDGALSHGYGPRYSRASLLWLTYEVDVRGLTGLLHAGNGSEVQLGLWHLPVDGYHPGTATVFQFHGCLYHGHDCRKFEDTWLCTTANERQQSTEENEDYLRFTCGYTLITIWECEWEVLKRSDPRAAVVF